MNTTNDGGPAFPSPALDSKAGPDCSAYADRGMSLRDYFANGLISNLEFDMLRTAYFAENNADVVSVATLRYYRADTMIKARKSKN